MRCWPLHQAKHRLSEIIESATTEGPQTLTAHGKPVAVVLSTETYKRLTQAKPSFVEFMRQSPMTETDLNLDRAQ